MPASPEAPAVAKVLYESFVEYEALYTREGFAATTPKAEQIVARMREGPVWLACREHRVLGTVAAVVRGQSVYMRGMGAVPDARGLGIGARLLEQVERWATDQGGVRIFLSTTPFLNAAIRLYERFGFRRTDEGPHDLSGTPHIYDEKECPAESPRPRTLNETP